MVHGAWFIHIGIEFELGLVQSSQNQSQRIVVVQFPEHKIRMMRALGRTTHAQSQSTVYEARCYEPS